MFQTLSQLSRLLYYRSCNPALRFAVLSHSQTVIYSYLILWSIHRNTENVSQIEKSVCTGVGGGGGGCGVVVLMVLMVLLFITSSSFELELPPIVRMCVFIIIS